MVIIAVPVPCCPGVDSPRHKPGLPSARAVSNAIFEADVLPPSNILTVLHMTYGQLIDHDTDVTPIAKLENKRTGERISCALCILACK